MTWRLHGRATLLLPAVAVAACGGTPFASSSLGTEGGVDDSGAQANDGAPLDAGAFESGATDGSGGSDGGTGLPGANLGPGAPGGDTMSLPCGSAACPIPGAFCCIYVQTPVMFACVDQPSCPGATTGSAHLECSGAANCQAGEICCAGEISGGTNRVVASVCATKCNVGQSQLCDPAAPLSHCLGGLPCVAGSASDLDLPSTFAVCK